MQLRALIIIVLAMFASSLSTHSQAQTPPPLRIESTPATVVRGMIPADRPPIMRVQQGQMVTVDTLSHQGMSTGDDPITFFARGGVKPSPFKVK